MLNQRRRALAALCLAVLIACPTRMVAASTTSTRAQTASTKSSTTSRAPVRHRHSRRVPPPGGVYARNAIVVDPVSGNVLYEKNAATSVPIASLTKLMTAMVFLDQKPDMGRTAVVLPEDLAGAGHTQLRRGERVPLEDLLHMSLMCSDNCATRVVARESGLSDDDFLAAMNKKALELGMTHTRYVEPTGLDERNVSTATDIARLLSIAAKQPMIHDITTTRSYEFATARRSHFIGNTNRLLYGNYEIVGGKTGFITEAGYCFATWIHTDGRDLIAVVLGAPTNATRFADVVRLVQRTSTASLAQTQN